MAKKGSAKSDKKPADRPRKRPATKPVDPEAIEPAADVLTAPEPQPEIRPGFRAYVKAILQLVGGWIRTHKLRTTLAVVVLVALGTLLLVWLWPNAASLTHDEIVLRVNKALSIQGDSHPAILTVEDETRATQPFLDQAKNGDKVLLYYKAKRAVLFRPSENSIIHQGSYTPPDAKVFIRRGTTDDGKVAETRSRLEEIEAIDLVSQDDSPKSDYRGITIVNVTDRYDEKLRELEDLFGVKAVRLPPGETFPDADILVIVGQ